MSWSFRGLLVATSTQETQLLGFKKLRAQQASCFEVHTAFVQPCAERETFHLAKVHKDRALAARLINQHPHAPESSEASRSGKGLAEAMVAKWNPPDAPSPCLGSPSAEKHTKCAEKTSWSVAWPDVLAASP